jgi:hypothetical protein
MCYDQLLQKRSPRSALPLRQLTGRYYAAKNKARLLLFHRAARDRARCTARDCFCATRPRGDYGPRCGTPAERRCAPWACAERRAETRRDIGPPCSSNAYGTVAAFKFQRSRDRRLSPSCRKLHCTFRPKPTGARVRLASGAIKRMRPTCFTFRASLAALSLGYAAAAFFRLASRRASTSAT